MDQLSVLPPQETEFFQPTQEEVKTVIGNKKIRRIFDTQLDEEDNQALDLFFKEVGQPENPFWTRSQVLRFLQANNFKHQQTLQTMKQYEDYRKTLPIPFDEEVQKFLNSGIIYIQGRDRRYRPLIVLNAYLINFQQMSFEIQTKGLIYLLEFIVDKMMIPGKIENWVIIIDFNGQGIMSLHINAIKQMMANLQNNFRSRLYKMFLLNTTMMFKVTWNLISPFLDEITKQKINFVKGDGYFRQQIRGKLNRSMVDSSLIDNSIGLRIQTIAQYNEERKNKKNQNNFKSFQMPPKVDPNEVRIINIKVFGGEGGPASTLAPKLGPLGLNPKQVGDKIIAEGGKWKGIRVMIKLKCQNRNADVTVEPTSSALLIRELGNYERDRKKTKNVKHNGNLTLEQIKKVALQVEDKSLAREFIGTFKCVLGTAQSLGATVDGQPVKQIIQKINSGELKVSK